MHEYLISKKGQIYDDIAQKTPKTFMNMNINNYVNNSNDLLIEIEEKHETFTFLIRQAQLLLRLI